MTRPVARGTRPGGSCTHSQGLLTRRNQGSSIPSGASGQGFLAWRAPQGAFGFL